MYQSVIPWTKRDLHAILDKIRECKHVAIITHTDLDGWMAAYSVYAWLIQCHDECEFDIRHYSWDYGQPLSAFEDKVNNSVIFLTDLILPDTFMDKHAERLVWIDHHEPAIEKSKIKPWKSRLLGDGSRSKIGCTGGDYTDPNKRAAACELSYLFFFNGLAMPPAIFLAGRYDVHDIDFLPQANYFNAYMRTYFDSLPWPIYTSEIFNDIITPTFSGGTAKFDGFQHAMDEGKSLCLHRDLFWGVDCNNYARIVELCNRRIIFVNRRGINSDYFETYYQTHSPLFLDQENSGISAISLNGGYDPLTKLWIFSCYDLDSMGQAWSYLKEVMKSLPEEAIATAGGHPDACGMAIYTEYVNILFDAMKPI